MKRPAKIVFGSIGLVLAIGILICFWQIKAKADATYHLANGMEITPIDFQPDEVERAMDVEIWKFNVYTPPGQQRYWYLIDLCQNGKVIRPLGGGGEAPPRNQQNSAVMTFVLFPVGNTFSQAAKLQCFFIKNGGFVESTCANPFQGNTALSFQPAVSAKNNQITLVSHDSHDDAFDAVHTYDLSLVVDIKPMTYRR